MNDEKPRTTLPFSVGIEERNQLRDLSAHPWGKFLEARAVALEWLRDEMGETPEQSARTLSMDAVQVALILGSR